MIDMKTWPRELQAEHAFVCAWRREKICKGYCDYYGLDESDFTAVPSYPRELAELKVLLRKI